MIKAKWRDKTRWHDKIPVYPDCRNDFLRSARSDRFVAARFKRECPRTSGSSRRNRSQSAECAKRHCTVPLSGWTKSTDRPGRYSSPRLLHANTPRGSSGDTHCADPTFRDPHLYANHTFYHTVTDSCANSHRVSWLLHLTPRHGLWFKTVRRTSVIFLSHMCKPV